MRLCADWWDAPRSNRHEALCWLVGCTKIWPPWGSVLTDGMHQDLTAMKLCADWWDAPWSDRHEALCWLVGCTKIWPPWGTVYWWDTPRSDHHEALCWPVVWWNAQQSWVWFSNQMIVICLVWLQLMHLITNYPVPLHLKIVFGI